MINEYCKDALSEVAINILKSSSTTTAVSALQIGKEIIADSIDNCQQDLSVVRDYFNSEMGSCQDANLKKLLASATVIAKHAGVLPTSLAAVSSTAIAASVDEGLNQMKVAYQVAHEIIESDEAIDALVDSAVARASVAIDAAVPEIKKLADQAVDIALPKAVETVCIALESQFPPAALVTPIIRKVTPYIAPPIKKAIHKGIDIVVPKVKSVINHAASKVKTFGNLAKELLFG